MYVIYYIVFKRKKYNKIKKIYKQYIILLKLGMKNEKKQYTKMKIDFNNQSEDEYNQQRVKRNQIFFDLFDHK